MFDIDGTLTRTDVADEICFVAALRDVFGFTGIDTDWTAYPHCSDSAILEAIFADRLDRLPSLQEISAMQARFVELLAAETRIRPFVAIPGAPEILRILRADGRYAVSLASGAWECSARIKLANAGLEFSGLPAAFADDAHAREAIMETSRSRAHEACLRDHFDQVIYVGDGVWDGRAARNLGFPFVGIASDPGKAGILRVEGAFATFPDYEDAAAFLLALESSGK
jgi:phosphoglycolate phosphatase-like HAD superfamily hydrolase